MEEDKPKLKTSLYNLLYKNKGFISFIYGLIILNVVALVLGSYEPLEKSFHSTFRAFEIFSVAVFTFEYLARLWTANLNADKNASRWRFFKSYYGIVDLVAILPFYLPMIFPFDLRIVRILRLFRLLRIFKLGRFSNSMKTISDVIRDSKSELIITVFVAAILLLLSSTIMFCVEHDAQPDKFASIGHSFWWAVATLTTVGYGDVYPITAVGKIISGVIALIGIGFVALPTGILSSAFIERVQENSAKGRNCKCPKCGENFTQ